MGLQIWLKGRSFIQFMLSLTSLLMFFCRAGGESSSIRTASYLYRGELVDIVWFGEELNTILFLTSVGEVHLSFDEGNTFRCLSSELSKKDAFGTFRTSKILQSKANKRMIYLQGDGNFSYVSTDEGLTWKITGHLPRVGEVLLHPTDDRLILASSLSEKCIEKSSGRCFKELFLSNNRGRSWESIEKYVIQFDWLRSLEVQDGSSFREEAITATIFRPSFRTRNQVFGYWHHEADFVISEDFFKSKRTIVEGGNKFLFSGRYIFVAAANRLSRAGDNVKISLKVSENGGITFFDVKLPLSLSESSYTILDSSEGGVFLHVNHGLENSLHGNVYASDSTGTRYSLSFQGNYRDLKGNVDFDKLQGLEGIYIANFVENIAEIEEYARRKINTRTKKTPKNSFEGPKPRIRSLITYDNGAEWTQLQPPKIDSLGRQSTCNQDQCSLHLHGQTDSRSVYTGINSPGIVLGTGNVGESLSSSQKNVNTYISRDGGLNWREVRKGSHIYEIGDHGGLLIMAEDMRATNSILYSWTQGLDWQATKIVDEPFIVKNIIIEPTLTSRKFLVYGRQTGENSFGRIVFVDLSQLHKRLCKSYETPGLADSDYEIWMPQRAGMNEPNRACHMGHITEYIRRKESADCFNPESFIKKKRVKNCECTKNDYECDYGYKKQYNHGPCERDLTIESSTLLNQNICSPSGFYTISSGYRLITGNTCVEGLRMGPTSYPCRNGFMGVSSRGWLVLFVILVLILGMSAATHSLNYDPDVEFQRFATRHFGNDTKPYCATLKGVMRSFLQFAWNVILCRKERQNPSMNESEFHGYSSKNMEDNWEEDEALPEAQIDMKAPKDL